MRSLFVFFITLLSTQVHARDGSWFSGGVHYENLASGVTEDGLAISGEGGYWYLGNMAYGGYFKANFFGDVGGAANTNLKIFDLGGFWKAGNDEGLYGKLIAGVAFVNADGPVTNLRVGDGKSFYFGLGGGFLFPLQDRWEAGPEVIYRHLTAGNAGDQVSVGIITSYRF